MRAAVLAFALAAGLSPCGSSAQDSPRVEPPPVFVQVGPHARVHQTSVTREGATTTLWIYLPRAPQRGRIPIVLVAPAGASIFFGMNLGEESRPEHLPYVEAGFAVIAYSVSGAEPDHATGAQRLAAMRDFIRSSGGIADARVALEHVLHTFSSLDPDCVFAAGHSSGGSVALRVAAALPEIRGVAAYAPVTDPLRLDDPGGQLPLALRRFYEGVGSPQVSAHRWHTPTLLVHANDDRVVPVEQTLTFRAALPPEVPVELVRVPAGDHYGPMIEVGIPRAISFFRGLCERAHTR
jgi:dipeptidyl aminopeptidase/acylaminoacyl peptidase